MVKIFSIELKTKSLIRPTYNKKTVFAKSIIDISVFNKMQKNDFTFFFYLCILQTD